MKLKHLLMLFVGIAANSLVMNAQDKKADDLRLKEEHTAMKDNYEQQKKALETSYKADMDALKAKTDLTPEQRKEQREAIRQKYAEQKKANQEAFKTDKNALKADRREIKEERKEPKVKP